MDKNTIWAIVLSTLVIIGAYLLMPLITGNKNAEVEDTSNEVVIENGDESSANSGSTNAVNAASSTESIFSENESLILAAEDDEVPLTEEKVTINTGCAEIIFTTKGGDIIRGVTYSAFMPLIAVAVIYLIMVMFFTWLVGKLERRLRNSDH